MEIKELVKQAHENALEKGFWEDWDELSEYDYHQINNAIGNRLMLIVGELAEAQEALRHGDMENFEEELADAVIRLADLCGGLEVDLEAEILKKMEKNKNRPYKHGKQF